jgi:hypothetical protein
MPARSSRSAAPATAADTIALSPGGSPSPARNRLASATSCSWTAATVSSSSASRVGAVPTQQNHAGDTSKRLASSASRNGVP